jgi:uncharacterized protein YjbI with pentapeptide repeats
MEVEMETTRVEGRDLVKNCVYNIYQKDKEEKYYNCGVWLIISDNNRNNQNILLRSVGKKKIQTWRTNNSEIYGETPIKLTYTNLTDAVLDGADLTHANLNHSNLTRADLTGAVLNSTRLINADLTNATLIRADLTSAILNCSNLTGAKLNNATLTDANLSLAKLINADLTGATLIRTDLTRADLTGANLTDSDLTGAIIFRNQLSDLQITQIRIQPNYIEVRRPIRAQEYFNISKELSNGNRISIKTGTKLNNSNIRTQHRISFKRLLDFLLQEENQAKISRRIRIGGEEGIDAGGITLIIFQKCYEAFMERYFYPYEEEDNSNYVVLKDLTDEEFEEFEKACAFMILLAKKVKDQLRQPFQILIPINFLLFQVLIFEGNPETFFELGNKNKFFGKRENGSYSNQHKLNNPYNYIAINSINNNQNNNNQNNNNQNKVSKLNDFSENEQKKLMFLMLLKQNHIHKRKQYETMKKFIDEIFKPNKDMFTTSIDYSYKAFIKRLNFNYESHNRNLKSFKSLEIASNPLIKLLLEYIKVSDEYRMVMTAYVCGSFCYTGDIKISIFTNPSKFPFQSHTCFKVLDVFIRPLYPRAFKLLKENNPNNINNNNLQRLQEGHYEEKYPNNSNYSIKKLYNIFLDRSTQIA